MQPKVAKITNFWLHNVAKIGNFRQPKVFGEVFRLPEVANFGNFMLPKTKNCQN